MNTVSKLIAALVLVGSFFVTSNANAQNVPTITYFGLTYLDADVSRFLTRPADSRGIYPYYVVLSSSFPVTGSGAVPCLNPAGAGGNNSWAVMYSNNLDFKVMRETVQLAYALNKRVRIYVNGCANLVPGTADYIYPVIWAVETL
jgi:hypothetical protein